MDCHCIGCGAQTASIAPVICAGCDNTIHTQTYLAAEWDLNYYIFLALKLTYSAKEEINHFRMLVQLNHHRSNSGHRGHSIIIFFDISDTNPNLKTSQVDRVSKDSILEFSRTS